MLHLAFTVKALNLFFAFIISYKQIGRHKVTFILTLNRKTGEEKLVLQGQK